MNKEHENKYRELNKKYGVRWNEKSPRLVGETLESLKANLEADENLNNVMLVRWDNLAKSFLFLNGGGLSLAEAVCMQKQAARDLCMKEE